MPNSVCHGYGGMRTHGISLVPWSGGGGGGRWVCCNDGLSGPLTRGQRDHWLGPYRWGKGGAGRREDRSFPEHGSRCPFVWAGEPAPSYLDG